MFYINGFEMTTGMICFYYFCDECNGVCREFHENKHTYFFRCTKCQLTYVIPKKLTCCEKEMRGG